MGQRDCGQSGLGFKWGHSSLRPAWVGGAEQVLEGDSTAEAPSSVPALFCLLQAKTKGNKVNVGVKYAEKQERKFEPEKLREGRNIIGLQVLPFPTWV